MVEHNLLQVLTYFQLATFQPQDDHPEFSNSRVMLRHPLGHREMQNHEQTVREFTKLLYPAHSITHGDTPCVDSTVAKYGFPIF